MKRMTQVIGELLAAAPDAQFSDIASVSLMTMALLAGSVPVVMEIDSSDEDLERMRSELPRARLVYLMARNEKALASAQLA